MSFYWCSLPPADRREQTPWLGQKGTVLQLYRVVVAVLMDILSQLAAI